jgi:hypothetical protein
VAAAFAEIAIGGAGDLGLILGHRFDDDAGLSDGFVEAPAGDWAPGAVDYYGRFEIVRGRHPLRLASGSARGKIDRRQARRE